MTARYRLFGTPTKAIAVTNVTDGQIGTGPGDVPPPGSQLNYLLNASTSTLSGHTLGLRRHPDVQDLDALRNIPIPARTNAIKGLEDATSTLPPPPLSGLTKFPDQTASSE